MTARIDHGGGRLREDGGPGGPAGGLAIFATRPVFVDDVADNNLIEAGLGWSLADGGTANGKVGWRSQV